MSSNNLAQVPVVDYKPACFTAEYIVNPSRAKLRMYELVNKYYSWIADVINGPYTMQDRQQLEALIEAITECLNLRIEERDNLKNSGAADLDHDFVISRWEIVKRYALETLASMDKQTKFALTEVPYLFNDIFDNANLMFVQDAGGDKVKWDFFPHVVVDVEVLLNLLRIAHNNPNIVLSAFQKAEYNLTEPNEPLNSKKWYRDIIDTHTQHRHVAYMLQVSVCNEIFKTCTEVLEAVNTKAQILLALPTIGKSICDFVLDVMFKNTWQREPEREGDSSPAPISNPQTTEAQRVNKNRMLNIINLLGILLGLNLQIYKLDSDLTPVLIAMNKHLNLDVPNSQRELQEIAETICYHYKRHHSEERSSSRSESLLHAVASQPNSEKQAFTALVEWQSCTYKVDLKCIATIALVEFDDSSRQYLIPCKTYSKQVGDIHMFVNQRDLKRKIKSVNFPQLPHSEIVLSRFNELHIVQRYISTPSVKLYVLEDSHKDIHGVSVTGRNRRFTNPVGHFSDKKRSRA